VQSARAVKILLAMAIASGVIWFADSLTPRSASRALLDAAKRGDAAGVRSALARGADVNTRDAEGRTPLILAEIRGNYPVIQLLLQQRLDLDIQDRNGCSALMFAAGFGYDAVVRQLVGRGANVHLRDGARKGALYRAAQMGRRTIVKVLQEAGAREDEPLPTGPGIYGYQRSYPPEAAEKSRQKESSRAGSAAPL
jgi:ankyrin repeat protein